MTEFIANFHFLRPWLLLLAALSLLIYWKYYKGSKNKSSWEKVCDKNLLKFLLIKGSSSQRKSIGYIGLCSLLFAIVAVSGPTWNKKEIPSFVPENPVMILLNMSSDMAETDLSPSRLDRAKYKIDDVLSLLPVSEVGLIVYSDEPYQISPFSDIRIAKNLLSEINFNIMPENGDRLDRAISLAMEKFQNAVYSNGNIIIFSSDAGQGFEHAINEAKKATANNYKVNVINVSSEPTEKLKLIAKNGNGLYLDIAPDDSDVRTLATKINNSSQELRLSENLRSQWLDYGYYLLLLPLLGCLYFFRRGIVWSLLLCVLGSPSAFAGFFINSNQEALQDYNVGNYTAAAEKFIDASWKGAAYYKQGKYAEALRQFSLKNDVTSLYNQGNALAKSGKIEDAITKYEEVLQQNPEHEDAKFNLEYLKQQQSQQKQQKDSSDSQDSEQKQEQQNSDSQSQSSEEQQPQDKQDKSEQGQGQEQQSGAQNDNEGEQNPTQQQEQIAQEQQADNSDKEQEQQSQAAQAVEQEGEQFDEKAQARALQYRDIPENPGGLLKAFINKEYMKKRYAE